MRCASKSLIAATHLSNQCYDICVRREAGQCAICYVPAVFSATAETTNSFGLSCVERHYVLRTS